MGTSSINGPFSMAMLNNQRVEHQHRLSYAIYYSLASPDICDGQSSRIPSVFKLSHPTSRKYGHFVNTISAEM